MSAILKKMWLWLNCIIQWIIKPTLQTKEYLMSFMQQIWPNLGLNVFVLFFYLINPHTALTWQKLPWFCDYMIEIWNQTNKLGVSPPSKALNPHWIMGQIIILLQSSAVKSQWDNIHKGLNVDLTQSKCLINWWLLLFLKHLHDLLKFGHLCWLNA